jgi:hypothetical protein
LRWQRRPICRRSGSDGGLFVHAKKLLEDIPLIPCALVASLRGRSSV